MIKNRGMSLVEVLVAVGIMSIVALSFATMMSNQQKEAKAVSETLAKLDLEKLLIAALADGSICSFELTQGPTTFDSTLLASATPPVLTLPSIHAASNAAAPLLVANNAQASPSSNSLTVQSIKFEAITNAGNANQYLADLKISFNSGTVRSIRPIALKMILNTSSASPANAKLITSCLRAPGTGDLWTITPANIADIYYNTGKVGIGTLTPAVTLDVVGPVQATSFLYSSDSRLKMNIREIPNALDRAQKLRGVIFEWKNKTSAARAGDQIGLIAQEVEKIFPEAVITTANGMKSVEYGNLVAPLIEALKEQSKILRRQQATIIKQQQEIDGIKKILSN